MKSKSVKVIAAVTAVVVAAGIPTAGVAASKTSSHKVNIKAKFKQTGTKLTGTYKGTPWGSGKVTGTLVLPHAKVILHTKIGNATLEYDGKLSGTSVIGNWKFTHGTGKLKHVKGTGKAKGTLSGDFTYTGTAKY
ncbi:MAG: hypothetical protein V7607_614 [Solirubrobacteraceae bacterium]